MNNKGVSNIIGILLILFIVITFFSLMFNYIDFNKCSDVYAEIDVDEEGNVNIIDRGNVEYFIIDEYESELTYDNAKIDMVVINGDNLLNKGLKNVMNKQIKNKQESLENIRITDKEGTIAVLEDTNDEVTLDKNNIKGKIILRNQDMVKLFPPGINNVINKNIKKIKKNSKFNINLKDGKGFKITDDTDDINKSENIRVIGVNDGCRKLLN